MGVRGRAGGGGGRRAPHTRLLDEQKVVRLDVSVHNALGVALGDETQHRAHDVGHLCVWGGWVGVWAGGWVGGWVWWAGVGGRVGHRAPRALPRPRIHCALPSLPHARAPPHHLLLAVLPLLEAVQHAAPLAQLHDQVDRGGVLKRVLHARECERTLTTRTITTAAAAAGSRASRHACTKQAEQGVIREDYWNALAWRNTASSDPPSCCMASTSVCSLSR